MSANEREVKILIDADVLIHLFKADNISILNQLFPKRLFMLDVVLSELRKNPTMRSRIDSIFLFSGIKELKFPTTENQQLFSEFINLSSTIHGEGERASLLYCKFFKDIIASSNTKDITSFCTAHDIPYLTTLDIYCIAIKKSLMTEAEVNSSISKILSNGSHLCCKNISDHLSNHFDILKLQF
jgi:hypothetical protein